ncbi:MAG: TrmB family transcriptional regulator [Nitrososphaerales archaeon]
MSEDEFEGSSLLRVGGDLPDRLRILDPELEAETLEKVKDDLVKFGLTPREAKIYLHLARFGPKKANKIAEELKTHRTETYHALTSLQNKGIVTATLERPISFVALPFEKAIEKIIRLEKERVTLAEKRSQYVFDLWRSLPDNIDKEIPIKQFQIFEGIDQAYGKMNEMQRNIESEVYIMASKMNLSRLDQEGYLDRLKDMAKKSGITIRLLVDRESEKQEVLKIMGDRSVRFLPANIRPVPHFILIDRKEMLFFTSKEDAPRKKISAIWTNYDVFTKALYIMFTKLWEDSRPM